MELRNLRYFITVAEEGNITRAAEKLCMTQSPLSYQMQLLEEELGTRLLIRSKRGVTLTAEGQLLLRRARELVALEEKAGEEIRSLRKGMSGRLSIGLVEGRAPFLAARWITGFREEYPNVQFSLWNGSTDETLERLNKGLADVAVVAAPYNAEDYQGMPVGQKPWVAMIPRDHPLAQLPGNEIDLSQLVGQPLIVPARRIRKEAIRQWFTQIQAEPDFFCETSNFLNAIALSEQGAGISIFPQTTFTPNDLVVTKAISDPHVMVKYVLTWKRGRTLSALAEEFIHYVEDFLEEDRIHSERFRVKDRSEQV